jgi:hypothetical protein
VEDRGPIWQYAVIGILEGNIATPTVKIGQSIAEASKSMPDKAFRYGGFILIWDINTMLRERSDKVVQRPSIAKFDVQ